MDIQLSLPQDRITIVYRTLDFTLHPTFDSLRLGPSHVGILQKHAHKMMDHSSQGIIDKFVTGVKQAEVVREEYIALCWGVLETTSIPTLQQ
ncbi:MAG: hypothetical protein M1827_006839 [Pycnora praestabilis]|nr:MAG: hypothetical protein M1827_006839 [Pycnora praestabilis]